MKLISGQLFQVYTSFLEHSKAQIICKQNEQALVFCYAAIVVQIRYLVAEAEEYKIKAGNSKISCSVLIYPGPLKELGNLIRELNISIENSITFFEKSFLLSSAYLDEQLTKEECWEIILASFNDNEIEITRLKNQLEERM